jgi:hypothetical protein
MIRIMSTSELIAPLYKSCSKCGQEKSLSLFSKNKDGKFGRYSQCNDCKNHRERENFKSITEEGRVLKRLSSKKSRQNNLEADSQKSARRRAGINQRAPKWDLVELTKLIYDMRPEGMEVDHIIPLFGKHVSGLHVYNNLQYMGKQDNASKGNRYGAHDIR